MEVNGRTRIQLGTGIELDIPAVGDYDYRPISWNAKSAYTTVNIYGPVKMELIPRRRTNTEPEVLQWKAEMAKNGLGEDGKPLGRRDNSDKPPLSMVLEARHAMIGAAKVMAFGEAKYDRSNWRNGLKHTEVADSMLRHVSAYLSGEDIDEESGMRHVDLALCNAIFLAELTVTRPDLDTRGKLS